MPVFIIYIEYKQPISLGVIISNSLPNILVLVGKLPKLLD